MTMPSPIDVLVLHDRPYDNREVFKRRVIDGIHSFLQHAPLAEICSLREDKNWDVGADANTSLVSVILATGLEDIGATYKVWDMDNLVQCEGSRIIQDLKNSPRIIAISSSHFSSSEQFAELIQFVRQHNREAPIIVGGQLLRICPDLEKLVPEVDYFVHGDGEEVFPRLVEAILKHGGRTPVDLPGVVYRVNGPFLGSRDWKMVDINSTPIPRWDLTLEGDFNDFAPARSPFMPMVFIEEIRGCLYKCSFCSYPLENPFRQKSPERIVEELKQYVSWGMNHFNFYSALFTAPSKHCRAVLECILDADLDITFSCQARVDNIYKDPGLIKLMKRAGCVHMSIGMESGDSALLKKMRKSLNVSKSIEVVKMVHDEDISVVGNYFIGFPGETEKSIENTYSMIQACNFWGLYLSSFVVERAADVYRNREEFGLEVSDDGMKWHHTTMTSEQAEEQTAKLFIRLARDPEVRTVLWVVQWRFTRFFSRIATDGNDPEIWRVLRTMQEGVANELEFDLFGVAETEHKARQNVLWKKIMSCEKLFESGDMRACQ